MKPLLIKILKFLITGSFGLILAACYGVVMTFDKLQVFVQNTSGEPIPGLKVNLIDDGDSIGEAYTDAAGRALFNDTGDEVRIQDVDGPQNGSYIDEEKEIDAGDGYVEITLIPKTE